MLRAALQRETEAIYSAFGEIILIESNDSDDILALSSKSLLLTVKNTPQFNAVRWDTDTEYGFERMSEPMHNVAKNLIARLRGQIDKYRLET